MNRTEMQAIVDKHKPFTDKLYELLKSILNESEIKYQMVEKRTKTVDSLEDKIKRKQIINIEKEITDISGLRIILYYQDEVDRISDLIKENFEVDENNSTDIAKKYDSNEFGYLSIHRIISLDNKRNNLTEWKMFSSLKAEIQVRTVLQHSWASISHEISYKKSYDIPEELQRKLFRLAGLFELADEQFLNIRDEHNILKQSIEKRSQSNEIENERINLLTLKYSFQKEESIYKLIEKLAVDSGFETWKSMREIIDEKYLSEIIHVTEFLGYNWISELEENLKAHFDEMKPYFKGLISDLGTTWYGDRAFYNMLAVLYLLDDVQFKEFMFKANWSPTVLNRITNVRQKTKKLNSKP